MKKTSVCRLVEQNTKPNPDEEIAEFMKKSMFDTNSHV